MRSFRERMVVERNPILELRDKKVTERRHHHHPLLLMMMRTRRTLPTYLREECFMSMMTE